MVKSTLGADCGPNAPASPLEIALLALTAENADLRLRLAEAQEHCIEMAVDAGALQTEIDALRAELAAWASGVR